MPNTKNFSDFRVKTVVKELSNSYKSDPYPSSIKRINWIRSIEKLILKNQNIFTEKISQDFGNRSHKETYLAEVLPVVSAARHAIKNTKNWMQEKKIKTSPTFWFGKSKVLSQPIGVVAIISPWNYPLQLTLIPAINALSAGNRVLIKPSEKTANFSTFLAECITEAFDSSVMQVIEGDYQIAKAISNCSEINHLFFTGSIKTGRQIAKSAGENLIPTTLELGGKSPAYIASSANLHKAAKSIVAGKLINSGQTCVAPDYLLVHQSHKKKFLRVFLGELKNLYQNYECKDDFTSMINHEEEQRIEGLLQNAITKGAVVNKISIPDEIPFSKNVIKLILNCNEDMEIMKQEIFGPLLPVIFVPSVDEGINYVNSHDNPLALYLFGNNSEENDKWIKKTKSGGITINDCLLHVAQNNLPFGGVGKSGYGHYHGIWGFKNFSNQKSIFIQSKINVVSFFMPPYRKIFKKFAKYLIFWV